MIRTKAREIALHLICEMGFQQFEDENLNDRLDESIMASISGDIALYAGKLSDQQTQYIRSVVKGVAGRLEELDRTIEAYSCLLYTSPAASGSWSLPPSPRRSCGRSSAAPRGIRYTAIRKA